MHTRVFIRMQQSYITVVETDGAINSKGGECCSRSYVHGDDDIGEGFLFTGCMSFPRHRFVIVIHLVSSSNIT